LLKSETPLDDALKAWKPLEKLAARRVETWTTGYEIFIRKSASIPSLQSSEN
jgi:peptide alpha-N-acetyltransferase